MAALRRSLRRKPMSRTSRAPRSSCTSPLLRVAAIAVAATLGGPSGCADDGAPEDTDTGVQLDGGSDVSGGSDAGLDAADTTDDATTDDATPDADSPRPDNVIAYVYDPFEGPALTTLPDDAYTVPSASTATGLEIDIGDRTAWRAALTGLPADVVGGLDGLDGWGVNAGISLVFDGLLGELPSGYPASVESDALQLLELTDGAPIRVPYEVGRTEDDGLIVTPMRPLAPAARHALVGTTALRGADDRALWPGAVLSSLLAGTATGALEPMNARYAEILEATELSAEDVAFAVAFTTQPVLDQSLRVAAYVSELDIPWAEDRVCEVIGTGDEEMQHCEGAFEAWSWRDEQGMLGDGDPVRAYELPVSIWMPTTEGPHPTAVFGHGLAHGREVGHAMARIAVPLGIAVVAIDAVGHGEHPDTPEDASMVLFEFFSLSVNPLGHNPRRLRDNFRQSTWDKLQLMRVLEGEPDVDGDDVDDLDLSRMIYIGESFGGIMSMEFLALTNQFDAAALQLAGGSVTSIIGAARRFQAVRVIVGGSASPSEVERFFPMVQTVVDAGDASTWAPHVVTDRLPEIGGEAPHLLLQLVIDDNTIPDPSSDALVRALGIPHMPPVLRAVPLSTVTDAAPVSGNDAGRTSAFFQFDRIHRNADAEEEVASHDYTPGSVEGIHQLRAFLASWVAGETPVVVDPYAELTFP